MTAAAPSEEFQFADIDRHFARFITRFGGDGDVVGRVAALLSRAVREGHICLDVTSASAAPFVPRTRWHDDLKTSPAFGTPESNAPIVVSGDRLFFRRYWDYEQSLAKSVIDRARRNAAVLDTRGDQTAAIDGALRNFFTIISGGPGTGKTTTALKILQRFVEQSHPDGRPRIALATPTGKAAARIQELLRTFHEDVNVPSKIRELVPQNASTIHRLLGVKPHSVFFRHHRANPLPLDLLIVDEASMVPLPLMAKLFDALLENTRVILLGDRDQLASVEPGAVLADIADAALAEKSPIRNSLFVLSKNFRFGNNNAIYRLSNSVRQGDSSEASRVLAGEAESEVTGTTLPTPAQLTTELGKIVLNRYKNYFDEKDPFEALKAFGRFRILCGLRQGPFGVTQINRCIESALHRNGLITDPSQPYAGKPILITRNDYQAQLYNGDIGIIMPDPNEPDKKQLWAWFAGVNASPRRLSPARLPEHDVAYSMTVHKAQGSEFDDVLFVLPDRDSPVLSRELIYTAITRARKKVEIWFNEDVLKEAIGRKAVRYSGLTDALLRGATSKI